MKMQWLMNLILSLVKRVIKARKITWLDSTQDNKSIGKSSAVSPGYPGTSSNVHL